MDFKKWINEQKKQQSEPQKTAGESGKEQSGPSEADILKKIQSYQGKSEDELFSELKSRVAKGKADGSFKDKELDDFMEKVSPMLTPEQRERLKSIVKMLK
ncbi:MAG TPA: hypothetical protein P5161_05495 [Eubacteriales bacterium]|jgi:hypothetical protein|nr:hypothetical protein [Clostridia bacterium]HRR90211.1 hypothetical protein [Eubacteriales bacterium]HRU84863.1 hypothetical protein [Eubacteriales bacterium]